MSIHLLFALFAVTNAFSKNRMSSTAYGYRPGDILLGGLAPVHLKSEDGTTCGRLNLDRGLQRVEAMLYSIDRINREPDTRLDNNLRFGIMIKDTCSRDKFARQQSMEFVRRRISRTDCSKNNQPNELQYIPIVVGASYSGVSSAVANLLQLFEISLVSYASTGEILSDRENFEYFARTVPSDTQQIEAIADIIQYLNFTHISYVVSAGAYGQSATRVLNEAMKKRDVCVADKLVIENKPQQKHYDSIATRLIKNENSNIIVLFTRSDDTTELLKAISHRNKTNRFLFIASDGWGMQSSVVAHNHEIANGAFTLEIKSVKMDEFHQSLLNIGNNATSFYHRSKANPWLREYWKDRFGCEMNRHSVRSSFYDYNYFSNDNNETFRFCNDKDRLPNDLKIDSKAPFIYYAVKAAALAVKSALRRLATNGTCSLNRIESCMEQLRSITGQFLYEQLLDVSFTGLDGELIRFSDTGDGQSIYTIMNYRRVDMNDEGSGYDYFSIGEWNNGKLVFHNETDVVWPSLLVNNSDPSALLPITPCGRPCKLNEVTRIGNADPCCWKCHTCEKTKIMINNRTDCSECPTGMLANINGTSCEPFPVDSLSLFEWRYSGLSIFMGVVGVILTLLTIGLFGQRNDTPIVKASACELSYISLTGILVCYTVSFVLVSRPSIFVCGLQRFCSGFGCSMMYAAILVKTNRIARIFNSGRKNPKQMQYISPKSQVIICILLVAIQVVLSIVWLIVSPPSTRNSYEKNKYPYGVLKCNVKETSFLLSLSYNVILIFICTIYAIKTRRVPENFNESKFIAFCMYSTCVIWLAFIPVTIATKAYVTLYKMQMVTLSLAFSLSASVTFWSLFAPKIYIIILHPEKNMRLAQMTKKTSVLRSNSMKGVTYKNVNTGGSKFPNSSTVYRNSKELDSSFQKKFSSHESDVLDTSEHYEHEWSDTGRRFSDNFGQKRKKISFFRYLRNLLLSFLPIRRRYCSKHQQTTPLTGRSFRRNEEKSLILKHSIEEENGKKLDSNNNSNVLILDGNRRKSFQTSPASSIISICQEKRRSTHETTCFTNIPRNQLSETNIVNNQMLAKTINSRMNSSPNSSSPSSSSLTSSSLLLNNKDVNEKNNISLISLSIPSIAMTTNHNIIPIPPPANLSTRLPQQELLSVNPLSTIITTTTTASTKTTTTTTTSFNSSPECGGNEDKIKRFITGEINQSTVMIVEDKNSTTTTTTATQPIKNPLVISKGGYSRKKEEKMKQNKCSKSNKRLHSHRKNHLCDSTQLIDEVIEQAKHTIEESENIIISADESANLVEMMNSIKSLKTPHLHRSLLSVEQFHELSHSSGKANNILFRSNDSLKQNLDEYFEGIDHSIMEMAKKCKIKRHSRTADSSNRRKRFHKSVVKKPSEITFNPMISDTLANLSTTTQIIKPSMVEPKSPTLSSEKDHFYNNSFNQVSFYPSKSHHHQHHHHHQHQQQSIDRKHNDNLIICESTADEKVNGKSSKNGKEPLKYRMMTKMRKQRRKEIKSAEPAGGWNRRRVKKIRLYKANDAMKTVATQTKYNSIRYYKNQAISSLMPKEFQSATLSTLTNYHEIYHNKLDEIINSLERGMSNLKIPKWCQHLKVRPNGYVKLASLPTPIEKFELTCLRNSNVNISIKRDDLTGSSLSGNKVRKLEYLLGHAISNGKKNIYTVGGWQSNHCRATSIACRQLNLSCNLILRMPPNFTQSSPNDSKKIIDNSLPLTSNYLMNRITSENIHYVPATAKYHDQILPFITDLIKKNEHVDDSYVIPIGGSNAVGLYGYLNCWNELMEQNVTDRFTDIFVTCGSGGTIAGLAIGNHLTGSSLRIHGIAVCDNKRIFLESIKEVVVEMGLGDEIDVESEDFIHIIDNYKGKGYSLSTNDELSFTLDILTETGISLDPTYTTKCVYGLMKELTKSNSLPTYLKGNDILFLNTGSTFGLMDDRIRNYMNEQN
ncbi:hypothetical protein SNEBB_009077 [Seison nebaliae]|nr:hypothetical protein SNEBB_009077 [Seison nebaliae]